MGLTTKWLYKRMLFVFCIIFGLMSLFSVSTNANNTVQKSKIENSDNLRTVNNQSDFPSYTINNGVLTLYTGTITERPSNGYAWNFDSSITKVQIMGEIKLDGNSTSGLFWGMSGLKNIVGLEKLDTQNATDMGSMFREDSSLTTLDISSLKTSNVTTMGAMFWKDSSLTNVDLDGIDTSSVRDMGSMFRDCTSLSDLNLTSFNTSNVIIMGAMFWNDLALTNINLSSFKTSDVADMGYMFAGCANLNSLNLSTFDTRKAISNNHFTDVHGVHSIIPLTGCSWAFLILQL